MNFVFIIFILVFIIPPFWCLLYTFRHLDKKYKIIYSVINVIAFMMMVMRVYGHPTYPFLLVLILIAQFFIFLQITIWLFVSLYHLILFLTHKKPQKKVFIVLSALSFVFCCFGFSTHFHKEDQYYEIQVNKETTLNELNIATISDVHLGTGTYPQDIEKAVHQMNQKGLDLLFLCGDIYDESTPPSMIKEVLQLLSTVKTKYGIYIINGNHEYYAKMIDQSFYKKNNIHLLTNSYECIDQLFNIVGREDSSHSKESLDIICKDMDESLPTIILDHNPSRYLENLKYGDVQFSGHTHGGQVFPGNLITSLIYDNDYGLLQKEGFSLVVSSGFGSWGYPFRFMTNCEIVYTNVTF